MSPNKKVWVSKGCPVHAARKVKSAESGEAISFRCDGRHITRSVPSSSFLARPCGSRARYSDSSLPSAFIPACPKGNQNGRKMENRLRLNWKEPGSLKEAVAVRKAAVGSSARPLSFKRDYPLPQCLFYPENATRKWWKVWTRGRPWVAWRDEKVESYILTGCKDPYFRTGGSAVLGLENHACEIVHFTAFSSQFSE